MLVHPEIPKLLQELKEQHIPTIAITKWWTGPLGHIVKMEEIRFRDLATTGITFKDLSPVQIDWTFPELNIGKGIPIFKDGVALTSGAEKGDVLNAILRKSGKKFSTFIFVDDDTSNLSSFASLCQKLQMKFIGIEFTAAKKRTLSYEVNEEVERQRFSIFETEGQYLSQQDLLQRIKKAKASEQKAPIN